LVVALPIQALSGFLAGWAATRRVTHGAWPSVHPNNPSASRKRSVRRRGAPVTSGG